MSSVLHFTTRNKDELGKIVNRGYTEHLFEQVLGNRRSGLFQIATTSYKGAEYGVVMRLIA
jgi:hypothetical protein